MKDNFAKNKLIRITTVPMALRYLLPGQMNFITQNGFEVLMVSADGPELNEVIKNEGCKHIIVPMTRRITIIQDFKCLIQLIKLFKQEKPQIVHTHTPKAGLLGMLAAKFCGVKIRIHTVAGMPLMVEKGAKLHLLKFIEKLTYWAASNVWPNSYSLYQYIEENNFTNKNKLSIIAKGSTNGIDVARFNKDVLQASILNQIKNDLNYSSENIYLLCIGRLVVDKGIVELVNVFERLEKKSTNLKLIVAGDFENTLDPLPQQTIYQIQTNPNIIHIKWTQYVEYYMAIANYFVFPSHREGFPNVLLQAGAMKLPIICSQIPGNIDIVADEITGLIFEKGNENQLEEKINYALSNKEEMDRMAEILFIKIRNYYPREHIWEQILFAYKNLLKNKN